MLSIKQKDILLFSLLFFCLPQALKAQGGMWEPNQLVRQEADMQKLGLDIPVSAIYSDTGNSLNHAVVIFGSGCTGEMISPNGLLLTNHHCGYGTVQALSTPGNNYLTTGFWAKNRKEEIPCPGLTVTFVRKIEDVTTQVLSGVTDSMDETSREQKIAQNIRFVEAGYARISGLTAEVKSYYNGNQYNIILKEVFRDVRLVAFPPNGIGQFGGDTDNWMWPQQKGDFSVFRVYANADNQPADYQVSNVPYQPKRYLAISTSGYEEGDFAMIYGFPYVTQEYITSFQLHQIQDISYPIRIDARRAKLAVWNAAMQSDSDLFLKYAAKYSSVSNGYKKWQGALTGLQLNNVQAKKQVYEAQFQEAATLDQQQQDASLLLPKLEAAVVGYNDKLRATEYINETVWAVEALSQARLLQRVLDIYRAQLTPDKTADTLQTLQKNAAGFYKNYDAETDRKVFEALMPLYLSQTYDIIPHALTERLKKYAGNYAYWAAAVFDNSIVTDAGKMADLLSQPNAADTAKIKSDPTYLIYRIVKDWELANITPYKKDYDLRMRRLEREYMKLQRKYNVNKSAFFPDANQTLRLTYGPIKGIQPTGSDDYTYQTTIDEAMRRHDPNSTEFNIPQGLRDIYAARNYGGWAYNGTIPVNFISVNHTSGGNSGSPVLNAGGALIGINFDRVWDGTMSDNYFDPERCRNVMVDIRYVLFLLEKYGNAGWLLDEMKLIK